VVKEEWGATCRSADASYLYVVQGSVDTVTLT